MKRHLSRAASAEALCFILGVISPLYAGRPGWTKVVVPSEVTNDEGRLSTALTLLETATAVSLAAEPDGALVFEVPSATLGSFANRTDAIPRPEYDTITLATRWIDSRQTPDLTGDSTTRVKIVQFHGRPLDSARAELVRTGASELSRISPNAFLVWSPSPETDSELQELLEEPGGLQPAR